MTLGGISAVWLAAQALVAVVLLLQSAQVHAGASIVRDGETVVLEGTVSVVKGLDVAESPTTYVALRLDLPVTYTDGVEIWANVGIVRLLPPRSVPDVLERYVGLRARVTGTVLFRWYGPSVAPLPTMLVVESISGSAQ